MKMNELFVMTTRTSSCVSVLARLCDMSCLVTRNSESPQVSEVECEKEKSRSDVLVVEDLSLRRQPRKAVVTTYMESTKLS